MHQGTNVLINSIDAIVNATNLKTISNIQIPTHCIATMPPTLTGKCYYSMYIEVEINEISIQTPQLVMIPTVHLEVKVKPAQVPLTLKILSDDVIQTAKKTTIGTL